MSLDVNPSHLFTKKGGVLVYKNTQVELKRKAVLAATGSFTKLVDGVAGKRYRVVGWSLSPPLSCVFYFASDSTAISGNHQSASLVHQMPVSEHGYFETAVAGEELRIAAAGGSGNITGDVWYIEIPA